MNEVNQRTDNKLMKALAVLGFTIIIVFLVWLAIQLVSLLPGAFASLASLAEDVYNRERTPSTLTIETDGSVANSKESFTISWNEIKKRGYYTLAYECVEGVSLDIRLPNGTILPVSCGEPYQLPVDTFEIDMAFASEKERFVDLSYSISFVPEGQNTATVKTDRALTLVNPAIPPEGIVAGADDEAVDEEPTPDQPKPATPTQEPQYRYVYTTTYKVPVSDPNGFTDLAVTYLGVGVLSNAQQFIPTKQLDTNDFGAFQFKVKNIGTKTSSTWSFEANLPSDATYDSKTQAALKPNEEAVITIAFGRIHDDGTKRFGVEINVGNDTSSANNRFTASVRVDD